MELDAVGGDDHSGETVQTIETFDILGGPAVSRDTLDVDDDDGPTDSDRFDLGFPDDLSDDVDRADALDDWSDVPESGADDNGPYGAGNIAGDAGC